MEHKNVVVLEKEMVMVDKEKTSTIIEVESSQTIYKYKQKVSLLDLMTVPDLMPESMDFFSARIRVKVRDGKQEKMAGSSSLTPATIKKGDNEGNRENDGEESR